jgi:hypothetical protein
MPPNPIELLFAPEELAQNEARKRAMLELFMSGEAILVIGAGCSSRLGYPTWTQLLAELTRLARQIAADSGLNFTVDSALERDDPLVYARVIKAWIQKSTGRLDRYYGLLWQQFKDKPIDAFHELLVKLPSRGILTTNYDPSLDIALMKVDRPLTDSYLVIEDDCASRVSEFLTSLNKGTSVPRRIAHLHGRFDRPKSIILTDGDYIEKYRSRLSDEQRHSIRDLLRDGLGGQQPIVVDALIDQLESAVPPWSLHRKLLWSLLATRRVVFVGFSLSDPYLGQMLALVTDDLRRWEEAIHFAIMPLSVQETASTKLRAQQLQRNYAVGVVFYEDREGQPHFGLESLIDQIAIACDVNSDQQVVVPSIPSTVSPATATPGPAWLQRINSIMKRRAMKDAN